MNEDGVTERRSRSRDLSGSKFGRYMLLELIGEGGMGVVYKAFDPVLDRLISVKVVNLESVPDAQRAKKRLIREAQALAHLSHPNVVAAYGVGVMNDAVFHSHGIRGRSNAR